MANIFTAAGRQVGVAASQHEKKRYASDLEYTTWFDTYKLTNHMPDVRLPNGLTEAEVKVFLDSDRCHAILHGLLSARLCGAPELDVSGLRRGFIAAGIALGHSGDITTLLKQLFDYYDLEVATMVGKLAASFPEALPRLREDAAGARLVAILNAVERHVAALTEEPDIESERDFLNRYRRHVVDQHGKLEPPDFQRRRRVPIADLYVSPDIKLMAYAPTSMVNHALSIDSFMEGLDRTVLLGSPGAGKTTASTVVMYRHAVDHERRTPFLVVLRDFAVGDRSVVAHIEHQLETFYQCPAPSGLISRLLLDGAALIIFDGLDELLDPGQRAEIASVVERFATEYPHVRVLVTSRVVGYDQARLDETQFTAYRIDEFDNARVEEYVTKWFNQESDLSGAQVEAWANGFINESKTVTDLRSNPLLLALMCILYRGERSIPRNRVGVYEKCAELLFDRWDARRDIHAKLRTSHLFEPTLRHLAFWIFTRDSSQTFVTETELIKTTTAYFLERGYEDVDLAKEVAREFVDFCCGRAWVFSDSGLTPEGEKLFTFTHRTFLEYFTAHQLASSHDTPEKLARKLGPRLAHQQWEVVAELAIQIENRNVERGAERLVATLLDSRLSGRSRSNILTFLARCLESVELPPKLIRRLTEETIKQALGSSNNSQHQPFQTLLKTCWSSREIVRSVMEDQIRERLASDGNDERLNGLRIALSYPDKHESWVRPELFKYWRNTAIEQAKKHRDLIVEAASHDRQFRSLVHEYGLVTTSEALTRWPESLGGLIDISDGPLGSPLIITPSIKAISAILFQSKTASKDFLEARSYCATFGRFLDEYRTPPPWNLRYRPNIHMDTSGTKSFRDLDSVEFAGAVITLLIYAEMDVISHKSRFLSESRLWNDVWSYVTSRLGPQPSKGSRQVVPPSLPRLQIADHIQQAMDDWAHNRLDFVAQ